MGSVSKILIAADDAPRGVALDALADQAVDCAEASSGEQASSLGIAGGFDLILLDFDLGDELAPETCRRLQEAEATTATPVIIMAEPGQCPFSVARTLPNVLAVVPKPVHKRSLLPTVLDALRRASGAGESQAPRPKKRKLGTLGGAKAKSAADSTTTPTGAADSSAPQTVTRITPGELMCWSDVMGVDEIAQSLAAVGASGVLRLSCETVDFDLHMAHGQLAMLNPRRVDLSATGETALFGIHCEVPAERISAPVEGGPSPAGTVYSELAAGDDPKAVRANIIHIGIDVLRRVLVSESGYMCHFRRCDESLPKELEAFNLAMDVQGFLLRAHSMIDEFYGMCDADEMFVRVFRQAGAVDEAVLAGLSEEQLAVFHSIDTPKKLYEVATECRTGPIDACFELYGLMSLQLVASSA